jgi:hypothetical protein
MYNIISINIDTILEFGTGMAQPAPPGQWCWRKLPMGTETYFLNANDFGQSQRLALLNVLSIRCKWQCTLETITNGYGDLYFANANSVREGAKDVLVFFLFLAQRPG